MYVSATLRRRAPMPVGAMVALGALTALALAAAPVPAAPRRPAAAAATAAAFAESLLARGSDASALGDHRSAWAARDSAVRLYERFRCADTTTLARALAARSYSAHQVLRFDEAQRDAERVNAMVTPTDSASTWLHVQSYENVAAVLRARGRYEEALDWGLRGIAEARRLLDENSPALGDVLGGTSTTLTRLSRNGEALTMGREALRAVERTHGSNSRAMATEWLRFADTQAQARDIEGQLESARRADSIVVRVTPLGHPTRGATQRAMGRALVRLKRLEEARACFDSMMAVAMAHCGPDSAELSTPMGNLADFYEAVRDTAALVATLQRRIRVEERTLGPDHPYVLSSTLRLAAFDQPGDSAVVLPRFRRALPPFARTMGEGSVYVQEARRDYAWKLLRFGRPREAFGQARASELGRREQLRAATRSLSEREAVTLAGGRYGGLFIALTAAARSGDAAALAEAFDLIVRWRALVLDELAARRRTFSGSDPRLAPLELELGESSRELSRLVIAGSGRDSAATQARRLAAALARRDAAERALARSSERFRDDRRRAEAGASEVLAALPAGAALVSFVRVATPSGRGDDDRYFAWVVPATSRSARAVDLGDDARIEAAVTAWLGALSDPGSGDAWVRTGTALRSLLWTPLEPLLAGAREVLVVPDGALNRVPLALLPDSSGRTPELEGARVRTLACERDLASGEGARSKADGLLAIGGPDYDAIAHARAVPATPEPAPKRSACAQAGELRFTPLAGAASEVAEVAAVWRRVAPEAGVREVLGASATEAEFKREAPRHRVLHVATHGFFLDERCGGATDARGIGGLAPAADAGGSALASTAAGARMESPLRRSGLALAGANHWARADAGVEDGMLAADEIAALDLSGVRCAVLSACASGAGDFLPGEGVFGLARAFRVAGVRTLVTSLWSVDDRATREWMARFHAEFARSGDAGAAVCEAARRTRDDRAARGESEHPFYWAAFVATGR